MRIHLRFSMTGWAALASLALLAGCRSSWVQTTLVNAGSAPVSLVEVGYPGGTFGIQSIAGHASYQYRFRILAAGAMTIEFNDARGRSHTATGPELQPGEQGSLRIEINPAGQVSWSPTLTATK